MTLTAPHAGPAGPTPADVAPVLLSMAAGYIGHRVVALGLRHGLIRRLAETTGGGTPDDLAGRLGLDPFYVAVWCRAALAAGVAERSGQAYRLAPCVGTLLLDDTSAGYVGGIFPVLEAPELFDRFEGRLASGERTWWDDTSPGWIDAVASTGTPYYTRLIPGGLARVPGLGDRLAAGCRVVDTAAGSGIGAVRLARTYPACHVVAVDGDRHSVDRARDRVHLAGLDGSVEVLCSALEDLTLAEPATLVLNNISMHECRDIERVARNVHAVLEPDGWFVISDFPFPDSDEGLRTVPGRIMSGIQFFEAQIDDQLLPRAAYDELLTRSGFTDLGWTQLTPMHALTWGRRPAT